MLVQVSPSEETIIRQLGTDSWEGVEGLFYANTHLARQSLHNKWHGKAQSINELKYDKLPFRLPIRNRGILLTHI